MPAITSPKAYTFRLRAVAAALVALSLIGTGCSNGSSSTSSASSSSSSSSSGSAATHNFTLQFKGVVGDMALNCNDLYTGFGPEQSYSVGVTDLRFFVSNIQFFDASGAAITTTLNDTNFQLNHEAGSVSLIDFTSKENSSYCAEAQEGTARTNTVITGTASSDAIASVRFNVGVPQPLMKAVIAATDNLDDTPSPLSELYWSWASGYRHFVMNFTTMDATHTDMVENSGLHIGSRDCGGAGKALSDQDECGLLNTPQVHLSNFNPADDIITVDVAAILSNAQNTDFMMGDNFGLQCHSATTQAACAAVFSSFGLNLSTGTADAASNTVFGVE